MKRSLLFHRDFTGYTGGHGKVWDYFEHARAHPAWNAEIYMSPRSLRAGNPWVEAGVATRARWEPERADALFLAGLDWSAVPDDRPDRPVVNLVQHVRHADPRDRRFAFLGRRAVRICVSQPVADALRATGAVNGEIVVIPAALRLDGLPAPCPQRHGVLVAATKQPLLGRELAARLRAQGRHVVLVETPLARPAFLRLLAECAVAVTLPAPTEGFYLPALEAMALGCATVVPDCVGNRQYARPGVNALMPDLRLDALLAAVHRLDDPGLAARLASAGRATAREYDLAAERRAFHRVLDGLDRLWTR